MATHNSKTWKVKTSLKNNLHHKTEGILQRIMKTTAMLVIFILGTCFYMSTAAPGKTEVYNQVAKVADVDSCLLCNLLLDHLTFCEDHLAML